MKHAEGHKSELLFRKILIISLIVYCVVVLGIALTPYKSIVNKNPPKFVTKPVEIHFKKTIPSQLSEEIKKRMAEEQRKREEEHKKLLEEKQLAEEKKKKEDQARLEREKRNAEEQKRLEEKQKKAEEQKRKEEEKQRTAEQKKKEEGQRKEEEQKKAVKEQNRAVAMNTGILKAMKGGGRFADNVVSTDEINSAISAPSVKGSGVTKAQASARNRVKGSAGIGNVSEALPMKQAGGLSGRRGDGSLGSRLSGKGDSTGGGGRGSPATRSQGSVKEVLTSHRGSLDFIYRKALRDNPGLKGMVIIEFTIAPSGEIISTRIVSSTVNDQAFEQQILKRIQTWKFPPFPESSTTVIKYPLEFEPA